jgi:glyoxylase-like metal-dependent hydrolase (beta-lactamase superfamily II)
MKVHGWPRLVRRVAAAAALVAAVSAPAAALELVPQRITDRVYALIGPTEARTYENHALNANFGFVVTDDGVALIDSGASAQGAALIEAAVASATDQPVRWVINTGSQDHRWLGNGYFADRGAEVIALARTVATQRAFAEQHLARLESILQERLAGTQAVHAAEPIGEDRPELELGGVPIELRWLGDAHFPGDAVVWLPQEEVLLSGDLVYVDRMLGIHPWSQLASWQRAFQAMETLQPRHLVPGHGQVSDLARAQRDTGAYLAWLLEEVGQAVEDWEPLSEVVERLGDAAQFRYLEHFDGWHRSNVNRAYLELERASAP